ncbi:MAG: DUF1152 domain-containing protein [Acidobacteriota bacterium]
MLEQPIVKVLEGCRSVLLAGCGGGYDVMGAVPLYQSLAARGIRVHLASLSFTLLNALDAARQDRLCPNLYEVDVDAATERQYCPEAWLAWFLDERLGDGHVVHCFDKTGVRPLAAAYATLVERLAIDAIVLIDGGIDALLRGDERSLGTPTEDLTSLAAISALPVRTKVLACVGMSAELRDGIGHADALERIASHTRRGSFLGAAALLPGTPAGDLYLDAVEFVFSHQAGVRRSHVHTVVRDACRGEFGERGPHVWISPLMNMYWFFDAAAVIAEHCFLDHIRDTEGVWDVLRRIEGLRNHMTIRPHNAIPI